MQEFSFVFFGTLVNPNSVCGIDDQIMQYLTKSQNLTRVGIFSE